MKWIFLNELLFLKLPKLVRNIFSSKNDKLNLLFSYPVIL